MRHDLLYLILARDLLLLYLLDVVNVNLKRFYDFKSITWNCNIMHFEHYDGHGTYFTPLYIPLCLGGSMDFQGYFYTYITFPLMTSLCLIKTSHIDVPVSCPLTYRRPRISGVSCSSGERCMLIPLMLSFGEAVLNLWKTRPRAIPFSSFWHVIISLISAIRG